METRNERLFFEDVNDALRALVSELGGAKKIGPMLWPDKTIEQAQQLLLACLNPERRERLTPEQMMLLLKRGREAGTHGAMNFICGEAGYAKPDPLEPEDEKARLMREFSQSVGRLDVIAGRLEQLGVPTLKAVK